MECTLGIDVGGTKIAMAFVDDKGAIISEKTFPTSHAGPEANVKLINQAYRDMLSDLKNTYLRGVGVGIAGQIEKNTGVVLVAPNLRWTDYPLKQSLETVLKLPTVVTNDVRAATWGEWVHGAGRGINDLLFVFIGTGIGGGIVSGGKVLEGATNAAAEVGHMIIDMNGRECTCGSRGCLESVAGGWAIAKRALELGMKGDSPITAKKVFDAYRRGDSVAEKVVTEAMEALVVGVASLVNIINPARVVIGGGIAMGFPELIDILIERVPSKCLKVSASRLQIVPAQLGPMAGVIGAATLTWDWGLA